MGALSFAAGTLASLSSAFASKNPPPPVSAKLSNLTVKMDDQADRLFHEFSTGMKMLYQHGSRNPCNVSHISQQNVKLLYTNLKANASFRSALASIKDIGKYSDQWAWLPLISNESISVGMLFLPSDSSLSPNKSGASLTMHQTELQAPFANNSYRNCYYLSLEGRSEMNVQYNFSSSKVLLKPGESFATDFISTKIDHIHAAQGHSLLLSVQLPAV